MIVVVFEFYFDSSNYRRVHFLIFLYSISILMLFRIFAIVNPVNNILITFAFGYYIFHFGIVVVYLFEIESVDLLGFNIFQWYKNEQSIAKSYIISNIFLTGLLASILVPFKTAHRSQAYEFSSDVAKLATVSLTIGVLFWCLLVFTANYQSYDLLLNDLQSSGQGGLIGLVHTAIGFSAVLAIADPSTRKFSFLIFTLWGLLAFPLGLRGEVAFPALLALGILACQRRLEISVGRIILTAVLFFSISSGIAVTRISAAEGSFLDSISLAKGIAELGGSIRPTYEVVNWLADGDNFRLGETYYAPFERIFLRIIPIADRLPAYDDFRLMNALMLERAGPYGFSISAEAYYNFGFLGVFVVGGLTGAALRFVGTRVSDGVLNPVVLAIVYALFIHIRQAFITSFATFLVALALIVLLRLVVRIDFWGPK